MLPLRVLVVADLSGRAEVSAPHMVTKDTFAECVQRLAPQLVYEVPNHCGAPPARLSVHLTLTVPSAFEPEAVVEQVPPLRELVELRRTAAMVLERLAGIEALQALPDTPLIARLREHFQLRPSVAPAVPPVTARPPSSGSTISRILDLVDIPGEEPHGDSLTRAVDDFVQALGSSSQGARLDRPRAQEGLATLDRILSAQLDAVLHAPEFVALESAWRGLRFLVDRADFRAPQPLQLQIVSAPLDRAVDVLTAVVDEPMTPSLVLAAYALGPSTAHAEIAENLARAGESLQAPVVVGLAPDFLGLRSWSECSSLSPLPQLFERPEYTLWRALRAKDCAYWLALVAGRFFARRPHSSRADAAVPYREAQTGGVWANPVWAAGSAVIRSFAHGGIGLDITGAAGAGLIEDLPLCEAASTPSPLEAALPGERASECADIGVITFRVHGGDGICMSAAPVFRQPPRYADVSASFCAAQQATLQHSLLAGRMASLLGIMRDRSAGLSAVDVQQLLEAQLREFLGTGSMATVQVADDPEKPHRFAVQVSARPPGVILGRPVEINLTFSLPR